MDRTAQTALVAEELPRAGFDRLGPAWDDLARRGGRPEPFHSHAFLRIWLDNFAPDAPLRLFVAREGPRLLAALPLLVDSFRVLGVPVRRLRGPANRHLPRFDLLCETGRDDALRAVWSRVRAAGGFDLLEMPDVPDGGAAWRLFDLARSDGCVTAAHPSRRAPCLPLDGGFDAVAARLDPPLRQGLLRLRAELERRGGVELERVTGGPDLELFLEEGFSLAPGSQPRWGAPAATDPVFRGFWAELSRHLALEGELSLYFLRLDRRPVGFHYGFGGGSAFLMAGSAHDPGESAFQPGHLLTLGVIKDCCARGLGEVDFIGPDAGGQADFAAGTRAHHRLVVFEDTARGAALGRLERRWAPAAREVLR